MNSGFQDIAKRALAFLTSAGFVAATRGPGEVLYESNKSFVRVIWDERSGELNAFAGLTPRTGLPQDEYSLVDILGSVGAAPPDCQAPQVADIHQLEPFVQKLGDDLRTYAGPALAGDRMFFRLLETFRRDKAEAQMLEMKLQQIRDEADQAWRAQSFDKVIQLYSSIENHLSESEARKLSYARRHRNA